jgi:uncharacterized membrane protein YdfJ with MMPL/SSD domain
MLVFRSLIVPVKAAIGFLLSVGASFGATVAVFQWGSARTTPAAETRATRSSPAAEPPPG